MDRLGPALHATLDRNGDGKLTTKEADPKILSRARAVGNGRGAPARAANAPPAAHPSEIWTLIRKTGSSRSTSWPRPSAKSSVLSGLTSNGRRSTAPTRSSINLTATRMASSRGRSWRRSPDRSGRSTLTMMR